MARNASCACWTNPTSPPAWTSWGLTRKRFVRFKAAVDAPHGLILVTGPTGSGKTTTLYSALNELNSPQYNIITVEDPVEFQLPGVNQVPVKKEIGLTFANALRSILRQDPDIIMIGEIRDTETAEIAVESALTGHQVLSTMHCNDAAGAIARLDDMEIAPFLISSAVILSCGQRLMRRICNNCKEPVSYPEKMFADLGINPADFEGATLYRGRGCERCKNTGYTGPAGHHRSHDHVGRNPQTGHQTRQRAGNRQTGHRAGHEDPAHGRPGEGARGPFHARTDPSHHFGRPLARGPGRLMHSLEQALEKILAAALPLRPETVALADALGRIAVAETTSPVNLPPADNSSVDGYAVLADDLKTAGSQSPVALVLAGHSPAGEPFGGTLASGTCVRVFTGSVLPHLANAIVMQEDVKVPPGDPAKIQFFEPIKLWENIRFLGEDVRKEARLVGLYEKITAPRLGLLAAAGIEEVRCFRRPRWV